MRDKVIRVLLPYVIVGLFLCLLQDRDFVQMLNGVSHLWFLLVIFECYMLGKVVEPTLRWKAKNQSLLFVAIIIFAVFVPYHISGIRILGISLLLKYFPLYMMGMIGACIKFQEVIQYRRRVSLFFVFSTVALLLQQMFLRHPALSNMIGMAVVLSFFACMRTLLVGTLPVWKKSLDKCSMGIYIVHHILIQEMNMVSCFHEMAASHYYIYPIIQFIVIILASWGFVALCRKNKYSKYVLG